MSGRVGQRFFLSQSTFASRKPILFLGEEGERAPRQCFIPQSTRSDLAASVLVGTPWWWAFLGEVVACRDHALAGLDSVLCASLDHE